MEGASCDFNFHFWIWERIFLICLCPFEFLNQWSLPSLWLFLYYCLSFQIVFSVFFKENDLFFIVIWYKDVFKIKRVALGVSEQTPLLENELKFSRDISEMGMATHYSILAWRIQWMEEPGATVHGITKSWTRLKRLSMHTHRDVSGQSLRDGRMRLTRGVGQRDA